MSRFARNEMPEQNWEAERTRERERERERERIYTYDAIAHLQRVPTTPCRGRKCLSPRIALSHFRPRDSPRLFMSALKFWKRKIGARVRHPYSSIRCQSSVVKFLSAATTGCLRRRSLDYFVAKTTFHYLPDYFLRLILTFIIS